MRHTPCFPRRIPTRMFQRVRENGDETGIVRRLTLEKRGGRGGKGGRERRAELGTSNAMLQLFVGEEVVTGELQIVQGPLRVEEKGIATPARRSDDRAP